MKRKKMENEEIDRIAAALSQDEKRKHYVYALCDDEDIPFYIGKGEGKRVFKHQEALEEAKKYINQKIEENPDLTGEKKEEAKKKLEESFSAKLKKLKGCKKQPEFIIKWGLTEDEAFQCESALINICNYFSENNKTKGIFNLSNIQGGHRSPPEKNSRFPITKMMSAQEYLDECAAETIEFIEEDKEYNILCVNIHSSFPQADKDSNRDDFIYEACRGYWKIAIKNSPKFVFAIYKSRVVGIYEVDKWYKTVSDEFEKNKDKMPKDTPLQKNDISICEKIFENCNGKGVNKKNLKSAIESTIEYFKQEKLKEEPVNDDKLKKCIVSISTISTKAFFTKKDDDTESKELEHLKNRYLNKILKYKDKQILKGAQNSIRYLR